MSDKEICIWITVFFGLGIFWGNLITEVFG